MSLAMPSQLVSDIHRSYSDLSPIHISPRAINPRSRDACGARATLRDWELYYPTEKLELSANSITAPSIFLSAPLYQRTWSIDHFSIFELSCPVTYPGRRSLCLPYSAFVGFMGYSDRSHTLAGRVRFHEN